MWSRRAALTAVSSSPPTPPAAAMMERLGHEPATLAEFEAAYGDVKPADGEG